MAKSEHPKPKFDIEHYRIVSQIPPFVDVIYQCTSVNPQEFEKIVELAVSYPNDPRKIEMVRLGGDASAKVPYLLDASATPDSILAELREIAQPHAEYLRRLPDPLEGTIHTLLSLNMVPRGYEEYGIPALLEINRIQKEMVQVLNQRMEGRKLAQEFNASNRQALHMLDEQWPKLREKNTPWPFLHSVPEQAKMQYIPTFHRDCLMALREVCVVVTPPEAYELRRLTPTVLQNPLPDLVPPPMTGSVDWLIRVVGKVGRHFTRALLDIILSHLNEQQIHPHTQDYDLLNYEAQTALRSFVQNRP